MREGVYIKYMTDRTRKTNEVLTQKRQVKEAWRLKEVGGARQSAELLLGFPLKSFFTGLLSFGYRQSQFNAPPVWYSVTRVSKKFFSLFRSMSSLIQGNGLPAPGYCSLKPIWAQRRLAMNLR